MTGVQVDACGGFPGHTGASPNSDGKQILGSGHKKTKKLQVAVSTCSNQNAGGISCRHCCICEDCVVSGSVAGDGVTERTVTAICVSPGVLPCNFPDAQLMADKAD